MNIEKTKLISEINDEIESICKLDIDINSDYLKYSEWFIGVATGSFYMAIKTDLSKLISSNYEPQIYPYILFISLSLSLFSIIFGIIIKRHTTQMNEFIRKRMSFYAKQKYIIYTSLELGKLDFKGSISEFSKAIQKGYFLSEDDKRRLDLTVTYVDVNRSRSFALQKVQQISVALAFIFLLVVYVPL